MIVRVVIYSLYALLALPVICVIGASLTAGDFLSFPPDGLSLRWYSAFFADRELMRGSWISLAIAVATTAATVAIGVPAALFLESDPPWRRAIGSLFLSPLNIPLVLTGFAMLVLFTRLNLVNATGLLIGHVVVTVPYMVRTILSSLALTDPALPRAAAIFGAGPFRIFRYVTLPLLKPGLISGCVFVFLASLNNVALSVFIASPGSSPLPVVIFSRMDSVASPSIAAGATLLILFTAGCVFAFERRYSLLGPLTGGRV